MNPRFLFLALALASLALTALAAEKAEGESAEKKQATEAEIKARLAEHAARKKAAAEEVAKAEEKENRPTDTGAPVLSDKDKERAAAATPSPSPSPNETEKTAASPDPNAATVLPEVRIRKDRITELDQQLAKQNKEIAREKQNTKPTALDETINSPKLSKAFALFGGQSSEDRSSIAQERVAMMEEEKEIMEAISQAQTKEEKEQLQKVLDSMRTMRRELEQSLR